MKFNISLWSEYVRTTSLDESIKSLDFVLFTCVSWLLNPQLGGITSRENDAVLDVRGFLVELRDNPSNIEYYVTKVLDYGELIVSLDMVLYMATYNLLCVGSCDDFNVHISNVRYMLETLRKCVDETKELFEENNLCHSFIIQNNLMKEYQQFKERKKNEKDK